MIITYYSYKGGSGRTQLLANVAAHLCHHEGKKILLIDWDLEAPGLHFFFNKPDLEQDGLIEFFHDYTAYAKNEYNLTCSY
jgi:MinD-like ATPase involved in chromosome partitioning or flagellar assembly